MENITEKIAESLVEEFRGKLEARIDKLIEEMAEVFKQQIAMIPAKASCQFLSVSEAMSMLDCSRAMLEKKRAKGELSQAYFGDRVLISRKEINEIIKRDTAAALVKKAQRYEKGTGRSQGGESPAASD